MPELRDLPSTMVLSCKRSFPLLASPANAPEENTRADPIRRIKTFDNFMNSSFNVSAATLCRTPHAPRAERILFALLISESTRRGKSFRRRTARESIEPIQPRVRTVGRLVFIYRVGASTSCATRQAISFSIARHRGMPLSVPFVSAALRGNRGEGELRVLSIELKDSLQPYGIASTNPFSLELPIAAARTISHVSCVRIPSFHCEKMSRRCFGTQVQSIGSRRELGLAVPLAGRGGDKKQLLGLAKCWVCKMGPSGTSKWKSRLTYQGKNHGCPLVQWQTLPIRCCHSKVGRNRSYAYDYRRTRADLHLPLGSGGRPDPSAG